MAVTSNNGKTITIMESRVEFDDNVIPSQSIWINTSDVRKLKDFINELDLE